MNTCISCKGGTVEGVTKHFADLGKYSGIIENVPCRICSQCGEIIYNISVARHLEKIVSGMEESINQNVIVLPYSSPATKIA